MIPFDVLGVPRNCPVDVAKAGYRRLASTHHPDKGGDKARFQEIQAAWDAIEKGYVYVEPPKQPPPFKSSFSGTDPYKHAPKAGKPAPGYEARRGPPPMPQTRSSNYRGVGTMHDLLIELTQDQAFEGCTFPFIHNRKIYEYIVRPGTTARNEQVTFPIEEQIGLNRGHFSVNIEVKILNQQSNPSEQRRDAEMEVPLCALGLFTGGRISVADHLGAKLSITLEPGQDPTQIFKFPGHGYGTINNRGTLLVKIVPIFKAPSTLNEHERKQLQRLNEMT